MNGYWIGMAVGSFVGAWFGFCLCGLLIIAKRSDRRMEEGRQCAEGRRLKVEG